jgi:hypothetical protein
LLQNFSSGFAIASESEHDCCMIAMGPPSPSAFYAAASNLGGGWKPILLLRINSICAQPALRAGLVAHVGNIPRWQVTFSK